MRKAVDYGVQIARGLAAAHEKGIVHRDLKPENLFLTRDGLVKILDFGIAKLGRAGEERAGTDVETASRTGTSPGTMLGTVGYMSPEQVRGLPTDHRSDLFSFGAVLFEMLSGRRAFKGTTAADTLSAILREDPTEALGTGATQPPGVLRVVRRCLEKLPEDRFQTARDLAFALEGATTESARGLPATTPSSRERRRPLVLLVASLGLPTLGALGSWLTRRAAPPSAPPSYQRLTFRLGRVESARFAPDGETIVYGAEWGKSPSELFSTRANATVSRSLGLTNAAILSVSSKEEMAILLRPRLLTWSTYQGTLARAPLAGGTPREVLDDVLDADWSPDGKELAVIHVVDDRYRIEYPIGKVLYAPEPPTWLSNINVSRTGDLVAFAEHPLAADARGALCVVGRNQPKGACPGFLGCRPSALVTGWQRDLVHGELRRNHSADLRRDAVGSFARAGGDSRDGDAQRRLRSWAAPGGASDDLGRDPRTRPRLRRGSRVGPAADLSFLDDLSDDGKLVLGTDVGQGGGPNFGLYVQKTDGSPPVWLGEGDGQALSPDGRFALALLIQSHPQQLVVAPTGAGEKRTLDPGPVVRYSRAVWVPPGDRVVVAGIDAKDEERLYVQALSGGPPRAVTEDGVTIGKIGRPVSPDGRRVVGLVPDDVPALYPLEADLRRRCRG